jgi:hypothetical protein
MFWILFHQEKSIKYSLPQAKTNFLVLGGTHQAFMISFRS